MAARSSASYPPIVPSAPTKRRRDDETSEASSSERETLRPKPEQRLTGSVPFQFQFDPTIGRCIPVDAHDTKMETDRITLSQCKSNANESKRKMRLEAGGQRGVQPPFPFPGDVERIIGMMMEEELLFARDTELKDSLPTVDEDWKQMRDVQHQYQMGKIQLALALLQAGYGVNGPVDALTEMIAKPIDEDYTTEQYDLVRFLIDSGMIRRAKVDTRLMLWEKTLGSNSILAEDLRPGLYPLFPSDADTMPMRYMRADQARELMRQFVLLSQMGPEAKKQVDRGLAKFYIRWVCEVGGNVENELTAIDNLYIPATAGASTDLGTSGDADRNRLIRASQERKLRELVYTIIRSEDPEEKKAAIQDFEILVQLGVGKCYRDDYRYSTPSLKKSAAKILTDYYLAPEGKDDLELELELSPLLTPLRLRYMDTYPGEEGIAAIKRIVANFDPESSRGRELYAELAAICTPYSIGVACPEFLTRFPKEREMMQAAIDAREDYESDRRREREGHSWSDDDEEDDDQV